MFKNDSFPIPDPIVVLIGPTAIGKTALSIKLAKEFDFEIISMDSMQVYRYMNIGTAKITKGEMEHIPHYLIDVVNPDEPFSAGLYEQMALNAIQTILARGKKVLITGGTGLYLSALLNGLAKQIPTFPEIRAEIQLEIEKYGHNALHEQLALIDESTAKRIHANDTHRLTRAIEIFRGTGKKWSSLLEEHQLEDELRFENVLEVGLTCEREKLYNQIEKRSRLMLENGLHEEVTGLLKEGYSSQLKSMQSIGYSHMIKFIRDEWKEGEMLEKLTRDTRRYAKRQYTWFNKMKDLSWFNKDQLNEVTSKVDSFLNNR
jgi:tRNA dimethylallyltransferase